MVRTEGTWEVAGMAVYCGNTKIAQCLDEDAPEIWGEIVAPKSKGIDYPSEDQASGNAQYIVNCVNHFRDMLLTLYQIDANAAESVDWIRNVAREAIAKAEGR